MKPEQILSDLIRYNTTNPPGNESGCIGYIKNLLEASGLETMILTKDESRPNLYTRLPGTGEKPPLLLYGHVDVVNTAGQSWSVDPFGGVIKDGCVWGRGALDMKGLLTMYIVSLLRLKAENIPLPFDIILLCLCDEEADGVFGAKYICENHSHLLNGVCYALGELGGFSMYLSGKKFYPIMVSEKQCASLRVTVRGRGGHGSVINRDNNVMYKLGVALSTLNKCRLPLHITPEARSMIESIASELGIKGLLLRQLLNPLLSNKILDLLGKDGEYFDSILHNTANATIIRNENNSINVVPSEIAFEIDMRLVPHQKIEDAVRELQDILGGEYSIHVLNYDEGPEKSDDSLYESLAKKIKASDNEGIPIPYIMSGVTDGRFFAKLGIQTYGFTPMSLSKDFPFTSLIHGADERIPIDALYFGVNTVYNFLKEGL